jgi:hypothetical protein
LRGTWAPSGRRSRRRCGHRGGWASVPTGALSSAASCLKGFYLRQAELGINTALAETLDNAFKGAIRAVGGQVQGLGGKCRRGYGHWVRDILIWRKAPLLFRGTLVLAQSLAGTDRVASG